VESPSLVASGTITPTVGMMVVVVVVVVVVVYIVYINASAYVL